MKTSELKQLIREQVKIVLKEDATPKDLRLIVADYGDDESLIEEFRRALKVFGINLYESPTSDDSDTIVLYLTKMQLNISQLKKIDKEYLDHEE